MIPDRVETSISLEDRVSPSCEKIIDSLNKVLNVYDKLYTKVQNGLDINVSNNISLANNNFSNAEKYISKKTRQEEALRYYEQRNLQKRKEEEDRLIYYKKMNAMYQEREEQRIRTLERKLILQKELEEEYLRTKEENLLQKKEKEEQKLKRTKELQMMQMAAAEERLRIQEEKLAFQRQKRLEQLKYNSRKLSQQRMANDIKLMKYQESRLLVNTYKTGREQIAEGIKADYEHNRNKELERIHDGINTLSSKLLRAISIENIKKAIDLSDSLSQVRTRIDLLNQSFNKRNGTDYDTDSFMDYIYKSAQNARVGYYDMANTISSAGMYASGVFDEQKETVVFTNLLYKILRTNGMNSDDATGGVKQIINTMNIGELKSQQLLALFKQAPSIINLITKTLEVSERELEEMVKKGRISARALKDIIIINSEEINKTFANISMTWKDVGTQMENMLIKTFEPTLHLINKLANNDKFVSRFNNIVNRIGVFIERIASFFIILINVLSSCWNIIEPLLYGIVIAITVDLAQKAVGALGTIFKTLFAFFTNPYVLGIIATAGAIGFLISKINKLGDSAISTSNEVKHTENSVTQFKDTFDAAIGGILGVFAVIAYAIKWFFEAIAGFITGIGGMVESFFSTIAAPFKIINGLILKAKGWITGNEEESKKGDKIFDNVLKEPGFFESYSKGFYKIYDKDYFKKYSPVDAFVDAFDMYTGNNANKSITNTYDSQLYNIEKYLADLKKELENANSSLDITSEDLKYMRDIAERDAINRFTTAEIKVEMQNNNNINNNMDIDGMVDYLASGIEEAMAVVAEGAY